MKKYILFFSLLFLSACCTLFSGSSQSITFDSNVKEKIKIYVNSQLVCTHTPCVVDVDRQKGPMTIIAKADGYEDAVLQNKTKLNPIFWLNIIGHIYSSTTDFATDSMWKYSQNGIYINMEKKDMSISEKIQFEKDAKIRHYALYSYAELKANNPEYMKALAGLTEMNKTELHDIIASSSTEAELANNLIKK